MERAAADSKRGLGVDGLTLGQRAGIGGRSYIETRPLEGLDPGVRSGQGRPCRAYVTRGSGQDCGLFTPGAAAGCVSLVGKDEFDVLGVGA